jgi:hypothetical protein
MNIWTRHLYWIEIKFIYKFKLNSSWTHEKCNDEKEPMWDVYIQGPRDVRLSQGQSQMWDLHPTQKAIIIY